jgi:hypothetical protein
MEEEESTREASSTSENDFLWSTSGPRRVRRLKGLGPRAYEQLHWYLDGAIKFDRHVEGFASEALGRAVTDKEAKEAFAEIASEMGMGSIFHCSNCYAVPRKGRSCRKVFERTTEMLITLSIVLQAPLQS